MPITVELFAGATFWTWIIRFPLGVLSALKRNSAADICMRSIALAGVSIPSFWEGIILIYLFAVHFHVLPPSGFSRFSENVWLHIGSLVMPTFVLGTHAAGLLGRYVRSGLLEVLTQDFIRTAVAKGLQPAGRHSKTCGQARNGFSGHCDQPCMRPFSGGCVPGGVCLCHPGTRSNGS